MVQLFDQIGFGQWFRYVTAIVEIIGAAALIYPGFAALGGLWIGGTLVGAIATNLLVQHVSPLPSVIMGLISLAIIYLRRDELAALAAKVSN